MHLIYLQPPQTQFLNAATTGRVFCSDEQGMIATAPLNSDVESQRERKQKSVGVD